MQFLWGLGVGLIGGFFGAGGGSLAVALLEHQGLSPKKSHAASLGLMLPISGVSLLVYAFHKSLPLKLGLILIFPALIGSLFGAWALKKLSAPILKLIFSLMVLFSAIKILLR